MKVFSSLILAFLIIILIAPILFVVIISLQGYNKHIYDWYLEAINDKAFINSLLLSLLVSLITSISSTLFAFFISLSWFNKVQKNITIIFILIFGLMPPDILSIAINFIAQFFGFYESNLLFLMFGLFLYCFPYAILIFWSNFYYIDPVIIIVAQDLGITRVPLILKILIPMSKKYVINCLLICFLLSFNEYPRSFYLSGHSVLLSEYLNAKLNSGIDSSVYAGASITVFITLLLISILFIIQNRYTFFFSNKSF